MSRRYCMKPGCHQTTIIGWYCDEHRTTRVKQPDTRQSAAVRGYDRAWLEFSKGFLSRYPTCAVCGQPATVTGHFSMSAAEMMKVYGRQILEDQHYRPLCRSCNAKDRVYNGR